MRMCKHQIFLFILLLYGFTVNAQNKKHDWSIGANSGIYSYSAVLERKLTNPYEYNIGANVTVSRYLNNHFDLTLQGNRSSINYPISVIKGEPSKYTPTKIHGANFTLKYKIDNGYILKEHSMFAPYLTLGGGAYMAAVTSNITYVTPIGLGVTVNLGNRTSLIFESQYNRDLGGSLSYLQYNTGLKIHFGEANKKRVKATRAREKQRRYARIRKYREEQRIAQAQRAKKKLEALKAQGLVSKIPVMEEDQDLLETNQTIALRPEDEVKITESVQMPPSKPKEASVTKEKNDKPIITPPVEPVIPVSSGKPNVEENEPVLTDTKPPIPKPNSKRTEIVTETKPNIVVEEAKPEKVNIPAPPSKPSSKEIEAVTEKPNVVAEAKPETVIKPEIEETKPPKTIEKPVVVPAEPEVVVATEEEPEEQPETAEEIEHTCKNSEGKLSKIGENINFDSDRSRIRSRMHNDLAEIIDILKSCDKYSYVIIAHTDSDGNADYNKKLAAQRAKAIKEYLVKQGVDGNRLVTVAYGASVPIAPNTSSNNKAKNRRIEFRLNRTSFED